MKGRLSTYIDNALETDYFIRDFNDDIRKMPIGISSQKNAEDIMYNRYLKTRMCHEENLSFHKEYGKSKMMLFYSVNTYKCNCSPHNQKKKTTMLFSPRNINGHAFAICPDCLLKLSLVLLKYYIDGKFYKYPEERSYIRLEPLRSNSISVCYLCCNRGKRFKLTLNNHNIILCENCLYEFTEMILTSPTVKSLYSHLTKRYLLAKEEHIRAEKNK